ncbi:MAG TPA: hypothetical protein VMG82_19965 [Candidatus Sulfotelmatobacter sp.]|nr:hypothetical protein [Candidatus Sulfotelmatobacter sp.]
MTESVSGTRYVAVSFLSGLLFVIMDGLIHANPFARKLFEAYQPLARTSVNAPAGLAIDLAYGFLLTGLFLLLFRSLPGDTSLVRGISFGAMVWIFRVAMGVAGEWMILKVPVSVHAYRLFTGLGEMLVLGAIMGFAFRRQITQHG